MKQYLDLMRHVREHGTFKSDRTGTGTYSVFGHQMRFDLAAGFPLVTTKKCHLKSIVHELLWFLKGSTNIAYLKEHGVSIWDEWADENGDLGPVYGYQWRSWPAPDGRHIDQIANLMAMLKKNPDSRRLIVSAWNPALIDEMALPPCHALFQFYVADGKLSCQLYQRSADIFLGVPFNIASYALLTLMVAQVAGLQPGEFIWTGGDCHLYANHLEQADLQLTREPLPLPSMKLNPEVKDLFDFRFEDFELVGYEAHPHIKAPVAVSPCGAAVGSAQPNRRRYQGSARQSRKARSASSARCSACSRACSSGATGWLMAWPWQSWKSSSRFGGSAKAPSRRACSSAR